MVKVIDAKGNYEANEVYSEIDLFSGKNINKTTKNAIRREAKEFLVNQTLNSLSSQQSPVKGAPYDTTLTKKYKAMKSADGRGTSANLEFKGDLHASLKGRSSEDGILLGHFNKQAAKADGHNNLSGDSELPERRYLPKPSEQYKKPIQTGLEQIVANEIAKRSAVSDIRLSQINTKADFYRVFSEVLQTTSRTQIRKAIFTSSKLLEKIEKNNLKRFLNG